MSQIIAQFTISADPTPLAGLLEPVLKSIRDRDAHVVVLLKSNATDAQLTAPNGATVTWPQKAAGGADLPAGTYRLQNLAQYTVVGTTAAVVTLVRVLPGGF